MRITIIFAKPIAGLALASGLLFASLANAQTPAQKTILLDALDLNKLCQDKGRPAATGEHAGLTINKRKYINGFHTRTTSTLYIDLGARSTEFTAEVGVDDRSTAFRVDTVNKEHSYATFEVIGDDKVLWTSGRMKYGEDAKTVKANVAGVKTLLLKITGGPGNTHADWVDAKLSYTGQAPRTIWSPEDKEQIRKNLEFVKQQQAKFPEPRINGAMIVGVRPNTPFYYPLAVSGLKPITFGATGLPQGLTLDAKTGIITGAVTQPGEYKVTLTATNAKGKNERKLRLLVGDKLALTPPMGYLSWNVVEGLINETFMRELADTFVSFGFRDAGYQYINMDDCWQGGRDQSGRIYADKIRFPNGLKPVGDYLHSKGLKFGIYSSPGALTCAGYAGTLDFEAADVNSWISWGVDYLKYDACTVPPARTIELYKLMGELLKGTERSVVYLGRKDAGSHLWRIGGDLRDQWSIANHDVGILQSFDKAQVNAATQTPGGWVDPDMLVVGIYGKGNSGNDKTDEEGCTDEEYRSHMSLWALMSSPLFMTADLRHISTAGLEILTNPEVTDVDQDPAGNFPKRIGAAGMQEVWVKQMEDGSKTIALFNKSDREQRMGVNFSDLKISGAHTVRDLWLRKDMGSFKNSYSAVVPVHGVKLIRVY